MERGLANAAVSWTITASAGFAGTVNGRPGNSMYDEELQAFLRRLCERGLPKVEREEEAEAALGRWISDGIAPDEPHVLIFLSPHLLARRRLNAGEEAAAAAVVLTLTRPDDWPIEVSSGDIKRALAAIARLPDPSAGILAFIKSKVAAIASSALERALGHPASLVAFLRGSTLTVEEDAVCLEDMGMRLPSTKLLEALEGDGLSLWRLRAMAVEGQGHLDRLVRTCSERFRSGLDRGLIELFDTDGEDAPEPLEYVSGLPGEGRHERWIGLILNHLRSRADKRDGFSKGFGPGAWTAALCALDAWTPEHVRLLAGTDDDLLFRLAREPCLDAALQAAMSLQDRHPASTTFVVLSALQHARRVEGTEKALADGERLGRLRSKVEGLRNGDVLVRLDRRLSDLPLGVRGTEPLWPYFGEGPRRYWCDLAFDIVQDVPAVGHGLLEFLLGRTSADIFDNLDPLVEKLIASDGGWEYLKALREVPDPVTSVRAGFKHRGVFLDGRS